MKQKLLITLLMIFSLGVFSSLFAQTFEYSFLSTVGTYTPITGGTVLGTETSDDQRFVDPATPAGGTTTTGPGFPIGFSFLFNGISFDRLAINNNGWISLGQSALTPSVNNASTSAYTPIASSVAITPDQLYNRISALARDIQAQTGSTLRLETIGTAPNRVCVIQWAGYKKYSTTGTGDNFSFQIRLYETTNKVEIVYGVMTSNTTAGNFQVGLRGPAVTDFFARTTATSWAATTAAAANTEYCVMSDQIFPANGTTFTFNYPQTNVPPNPASLVSPTNGATLVTLASTLNWLSGGGFPTGYRINFGTNIPPNNIANNIDLGAVTTYDPAGDMTPATTYYWQVIPYNAIGSATNCPVWSFTTHGDPTLTALPYSQNWDLVTAPALPFDWTSVVQSTVTTSYVKTVTTTPNTAPNCVGIYNGADATANVILVGPPMAAGITVNNTRVKFWGKGATTYHILVGVMSSPTDPATFVTVQDMTLSASWAQYVIDLTPYTGNGHYIAFKHGCTATSQTMYIDGVNFELIAPNDLGATTITGNSTPSVNTLANYTVGVHNWGTVSQSTYAVKLFNSSNVELASVAGPMIAPGADAAVQIGFTPTVQGPMSIYGKVVLAGDVNPANDQTNPMTISVMPAGATVVTIGAGDQVARVPIDMYYKNSVYEGLYFANEINTFGQITAISFYNNFVTTTLTDKPVKIWLGMSTLADLSAGWIPADQYTLVFDGTVNFPGGENTITIPLQTPYMYLHDNLIMRVNRPMDTAYFSSSDNFKCQTIGTTRARKLYNDTVVYDPLAPSAAGTLGGQFPMTSFSMVTSGMGSLAGTVTSGGNPLAGVLVTINTTTYSFTTGANGTYSFPFVIPGAYTVTATKLGYESQTLPVTIVADQASTLNFSLTASANVSVTGTVYGSDQPTVGLAGATISLDGPLDFTGTTNAQGQFTITGVLSGNTYNYTIVKQGYQDLTGTINVGTTNYSMGSLIMSEIALPPTNVVATQNAAQTQVSLIWRNPGSGGGGAEEDFEQNNGNWVPTSSWTNPLGDWQWTNTYNAANYTDIDTYVDAPPSAAHSGTGMWGTVIQGGYSNCAGWSYLRKTFNLSSVTSPVLDFWHYMDGYNTWDYGLVKVNGNTVWGSSAAAEFMPWQRLVIDLAAYGNQASVEISFEWYATSTVSYAGWYIDDLYVGTAQGRTVNYTYTPGMMQKASGMETDGVNAKIARTGTTKSMYQMAASSSRDPERVRTGYKVWRLLQGDEANEGTWTSLTPTAVTDTTFTDTAWASLPNGNYKWAVKAAYTNNVYSVPALSNMIRILRLDLSALTVSGTTTPSVGLQATYTVHVKNTGTTTQNGTAFTVKLMSGETVLASVPGVTLAPNEEHDFLIPWTPSTAGPVALTGRAVLPGDAVPTNDTTPILNISVMAAGVVAVTVGDGSAVEGRPVDFYYKNSLFQCLYFPSEIGMYGSISALSFYNNFVTNLPDKPTKIWLGQTPLADLSAGWILPPELTLVYDGNITYPSGENTVTIPLQTAFNYTSGNLVLYANRPMDTVSYNTNDNFKVQTAGTNRARKLTSDTVTYDPAAPSATGTLSAQFPQTTLHMAAIGNSPLYSVSPNGRDFGTVLINSTNNQSFSITNAGGAPLVISSISVTGSPFITLSNLPTFPATVTFGTPLVITGVYHPTAVGAHTATITIVDNMTRLTHTLTISGNCIDTTINTLPYSQNFDGVTQPALPPDWGSIVQSTVTTALVKTYTTTPHSTPNTAGMTNSTDANATLLLLAPPLGTTIPANTTRLKFWGRAGSAGYPISVGIISNPSDAASYTEVQNIALTTTWTEYIVSFTGYTGTGHTVAFKHGLGGTSRLLYVDDVTIELVAPNDLGANALAGNATPTVNISSDYVVTVQNWGTSPQSTYNVKLFSSTGTELASVAGPALTPGQITNVNVPWVPTAEGAMTIYAKTVLTGDQNTGNDQSPNLSLFVNPAGLVTITVGDGSQSARTPVDMFYKNSLFECLYYPAELGNFMGQITGLRFYNNFVSNLTAMPTKIWIGTTTSPDLSAGWIPSTSLTQVFDGTVNYPSGANIITIPLPAPYLYLNGENLVVMINRPMDTQYYSSSDNFQAQTIGTNRARKIQSDSVTYDPAAPAAATAVGQFPKTTFLVIPGGVGDILGTVNGPGNTPLPGVAVALVDAGYNTTTNAQGQYSLLNVLPGNYTISFSKYGYVTQTQNITLAEDQELTINVTMQPMATVNVTGTVLASDTMIGINGAAIHLNGYADYTVNSNATGAFTVPAVYANQTYSYVIMAPGYSTASGTIIVTGTNYAMGNVVLNEIAFGPINVVASLNPPQTEAIITWSAPDPNAVEVTEGFEGTTFPPTDWTQTITDTGAINSSGVYPTWCSFGSVVIASTTVAPPEGQRQGGLWWSYNHQDEWLKTPNFNCPPTAHLSFANYGYFGSTSGDHYYVKVSTDNGATWTVLWDASTQTGGWNYYATPVTIDLSTYAGQQIKLAWHAIDPPSNDGLWYVWFIDDIYIGNATTSLHFATDQLEVRSAGKTTLTGAVPTYATSRAVQQGLSRGESSLPSPQQLRATVNPTRSLQGYKVWRLTTGSETNEATWVPLTPTPLVSPPINDPAWATLANGSYRWAVKAIYTNNVTSQATLSNSLIKEVVTGMISGVVRQQNNQPIPGATVTAGTYSATTNNSGAYSIILPTGTYSVTASATNFTSVTQQNIQVNPNQTTTVNFVLLPGSGIDDDLLPVTATELKGNYPNPFNPSTTISYSVKEPAVVSLVIYNLKGQKVKTLVNEAKASGHFQIVWNGKDDSDRPVSSGVYYYRMSAGTYNSTRKMLLVE